MSEKSTKNGIGDLSREADRNLPDFDQTHIAKRPCIAAGPCAVWCPDSESNQGHADFQSAALPTELSGRGAH